MEILSELVAKITTDASGLKSGLTSADKSIGSFVTKNAAGLRSLGVAFTAMGAAIVGGLGASTKAAVDFETAFTGVRKTVEATDAEFTTLRQGIRDLAKVLPLPATEIAGIAQAAGQLGIKTKDIMKFTEVIAKLGMATDLTSQDAAVLLAKFTNVMRMDISNMDRLAASIVDLGNNMATNEPEIVAMASRLTGAAAVVGMTEANVIALAAALSSLGVEAQMGGTAVQRVLLEMNTAVIGGGKELKGFADIAGVTTSEFARAFKDDAASALITFVTGLKSAMDSGQDVTSMLKDLGLADMRVLQVLLKSAGGLDRLTEAQLISNKAWEEKIALDIEVVKRLEDAKAKMDILKNVLVDVGITVGDFFVPILKDLVDKLMPIIDSVQTWIEENSGLAKAIAITAGVIGGLMLVLGPLLIMLPGIISLLGVFGITLSAAIWPVTAVAAAIAALIAIGVLLWNKWNDISIGFKIAIATMTGGVGLLLIGGIALIKNWDVVGRFFSDVWYNIKNAFLHGIDAILGYLNGFVGWLPFFGDKIAEARDKISNLIEAEKISRDAADAQRALEIVNEALEETVEIQEQATNTTDEFTESVAANTVELLAQQVQLESQITTYDDLLKRFNDIEEQVRKTRKEFEYQQSEAGRLRISIDDVTNTLFYMGKTNEEVTKTLYDLGDEADNVNSYLEAVGLTAKQVAASLDLQKGKVEDLTSAYWQLGKAPSQPGTYSSAAKELSEEYGMSLNAAQNTIQRYIENPQSKEFASVAGIMKDITGYASGGIVPGPIGMPQLATVHGGETIIPANESMGGVTVNISGPLFMEREDQMNQLVDKIRKGIQRQDRLRFGGAYSGQ